MRAGGVSPRRASPGADAPGSPKTPPAPHRRCAIPQGALALAALTLLACAPAFAQERRDRHSPGLVLDTGARHASCDALLFTPDGDELLAAGDDKVVRAWQADKDRLRPDRLRTLRWPTLREQRGGIYAMALAPNAARVAVAGVGVKDGLVAVLDRGQGAAVTLLDPVPSTFVNWALAWSPNGKFLVYGNERGELWRWAPADKAPAVLFARSGGDKTNRVRVIAFHDNSRFVSVAQDGKVWQRDVTAPDAAPKLIASFGNKADQPVVVAAFSRASKVMAACLEDSLHTVQLLDLKRPLTEGSSAQVKPTRLGFPGDKDKKAERFGWSLAFNTKGDKLAIGTREVNKPAGKAIPFSRVTGGRAFAYALGGQGEKLLTPDDGLDCGYAVDAVTFRPGDEQLATAGGPNHEVRLWRVGREPAKALSEIRGPGSCLYGVAVDAGGKYLAWQEDYNRDPKHPNNLGDGKWRFFHLDADRRRILARKPDDWKNQRSLTTLSDWRVETTKDPYVWNIVDPKGRRIAISEETNLYIPALAQVPRCYTFLKLPRAKPGTVHLAIGHMWGVSLYELKGSASPDNVRLVRYMGGHEGDVLSMAPSADGRQLFTASRDQTIACWSLDDWPAQRELGASFLLSGDDLIVRNIDPGSPAWELGLTPGDKILLVVSKARHGKSAILYNPKDLDLNKLGILRPAVPVPQNAKQMLNLFARAEPAREYIIRWEHAKKVDMEKTSVKQRPLWRFFPTRADAGNDWVLWRYRDFYYDTASAHADRLVGWQVHDLRGATAFYPLSRLASTFHNAAKVWKTVKQPSTTPPEKVLFADIEPPRVELDVEKRGVGDPVQLRVKVTPQANRAEQEVKRVVVWVDQTRVEHEFRHAPRTGAVDETVTIPGDLLVRGSNTIKVVSFNKKGGHGEKSRQVTFQDKNRPAPKLHALCVGLNYDKVQPRSAGKAVDKLSFAVNGARDIAAVLRQQRGTSLFGASNVTELLEDKADVKSIRRHLQGLQQTVQAEDTVVLFLSGHGLGGRNNEPDVFRFLCADSNADAKDDKSMLTSEDLYQALQKVRGRKLIFLDSCHTGGMSSSLIRALNKEGADYLIFSACQAHETAIMPTEDLVKSTQGLRRNSLFAQCLLDELGDAKKGAKGRGQAIVDTQLAAAVSRRMRQLLERIGKAGEQTPDYFPEPGRMKDTKILCVP